MRNKEDWEMSERNTLIEAKRRERERKRDRGRKGNGESEYIVHIAVPVA